MSEIRRQARQRRREIGLELDTPAAAEAVIEACLTAGNRERNSLPEPPFEAAHTLAHLWLHGAAYPCESADTGDPAALGEVPGSARSKVERAFAGAGAREEAAVFAAELLLPGPLAHKLFMVQDLASDAIAAALGLPLSAVQWQLAESLLLPPFSEDCAEKETPAAAVVILDASQSAAAETECGPLLVGAGPGTGKTKTLVLAVSFSLRRRAFPPNKYWR